MILLDGLIIKDPLWNKEKIEKIINNIINNFSLIFKFNSFLDEIEMNVNVVLTNDEEITNLNKRFRNKNKPTNILSFPILNSSYFKLSCDNFYPRDDYHVLGDIVLSYNIIKKEALLFEKSFINHFSHLLIHGLLHIIGYTHDTKEGSIEMESLEIKILNSLNIKNPYFY